MVRKSPARLPGCGQLGLAALAAISPAHSSRLSNGENSIPWCRTPFEIREPGQPTSRY
jgi:hypothetical protein